MRIAIDFAALAAAYLIGSIPFGLIVVRLMNGKDLRRVESGRTGGTNAMRAAGPMAGLFTGVLDIAKAAGAVFLARFVTPHVWIHALAPAAVILGHNHSIFLVERIPAGGLRLRGGAGGAVTAGSAMGLWPPIVFILLPISALVFYGIGYASLTTISIALVATAVFAVRAVLGSSPWEYALSGFLALVLVLVALRPNLRRLLDGTERLHGWRARRTGQKQPHEMPGR